MISVSKAGFLVLLRHGQSEGNRDQTIAGQLDIKLTQRGIEQAREAAELFIRTYPEIKFNQAFSSPLVRARDTLELFLEGICQQRVKVIVDDAINERYYSILQGVKRTDAVKKYGEDKILVWTRTYFGGPTGGESMSDIAKRVFPFFDNNIAPVIKQRGNVLVAAHAGSLRAMVQKLDGLNDQQTQDLHSIPNASPIIYNLSRNLTVLSKNILLVYE